MRSLLLVLSIGLSTIVSAQYSNLENFSQQGRGGELFASMRKKRDVSNDLPTVGSIYINDEFQPCEIYYKEDVVGNFYYRHNAFNDEIEIKETEYADEEESSLATVKELRVINKVDGRELSLSTYKNRDETIKNGYLYTLVEGEKYSLYYRNRVRFKEGVKAVNSMVRSTSNKFNHYTDFYIVNGDEPLANYFSGKSKDIEPFISDDLEKAKAYMRDNKLSYKKTDDLAQLFEYLNS